MKQLSQKQLKNQQQRLRNPSNDPSQLLNDSKYMKSGIAIRNLNPTIQKVTSNSQSRNNNDDILNTEEEREIANMVQYIDEKIAHDNDGDKQNKGQGLKQLLPDIYQDFTLPNDADALNQPISMMHADSLYKNDQRQTPEREDAVTTVLGNDMSPSQISVQYMQGGQMKAKKSQGADGNQPQTISTSYLLPRMPASKEIKPQYKQEEQSKGTTGGVGGGGREQANNSRITLSSSINSSTKELLQLIQSHPRDSSLSNFELLDDQLRQANAKVRNPNHLVVGQQQCQQQNDDDEIMHVVMKQRKISASGMLPQLENGTTKVISQQHDHHQDGAHSTSQDPLKNRNNHVKNFVSNRVNKKNTQVLMTRLPPQRNKAVNQTIDWVESSSQNKAHLQPYLNAMSIKDANRNKKISSEEQIMLVKKKQQQQQRGDKQSSNASSRGTTSNKFHAARPHVSIQLKQNNKVLLNQDLITSGGSNNSDEHHPRRNSRFHTSKGNNKSQIKLMNAAAHQQHDSSLSSSLNTWSKQPVTFKMSKKATLNLQDAAATAGQNLPADASERALPSEATLTYEEDATGSPLYHQDLSSSNQMIMLELSPEHHNMRYNDIMSSQAANLLLESENAAVDKAAGDTVVLKSTAEQNTVSQVGLAQPMSQSKKHHGSAARNSIVTFEFDRVTTDLSREPLQIIKRARQKQAVGRLRYQSLQDPRSHQQRRAVDRHSQESLLSIQQSLERRPLAGIYQKVRAAAGEKQETANEQDKKVAQGAPSPGHDQEHQNGDTVTPARLPQVTGSKLDSNLQLLQVTANQTGKNDTSLTVEQTSSAAVQQLLDFQSPLAPLYRHSAQSLVNKNNSKGVTPSQKSASAMMVYNDFNEVIDHGQNQLVTKQQITQLTQSLKEMAGISSFLDQQQLDQLSNELDDREEAPPAAATEERVQTDQDAARLDTDVGQGQGNGDDQGDGDFAADLVAANNEAMMGSFEATTAYLLEGRLPEGNAEQMIRLEENQRSSFDLSNGTNTQNAAYFHTVQSSDNQQVPNHQQHNQQQFPQQQYHLKHANIVPLPHQWQLDAQNFQTVGFGLGAHLIASHEQTESQKQLYSTMQDHQSTKKLHGDNSTNVIPAKNVPIAKQQSSSELKQQQQQPQNNNVSVNSYHQPLSRLSEKSSQPTLGFGQNNRPDYVNSDLSDLDKRLVPIARGDSSSPFRDKRRSQPRLGAMDKGQIKIKVKHQDAKGGQRKTVIHQHNNSSKRLPSPKKKRLKRKRKSNSVAIEGGATAEQKISQLKKSTEKAFAAVETQTPAMNDIVIDETLVFASPANEPMDQVILIQTDNQGLITFQDLAYEQSLSYSKIQHKPSYIQGGPQIMKQTSSMISSGTLDQSGYLIQAQYAAKLTDTADQTILGVTRENQGGGPAWDQMMTMSRRNQPLDQIMISHQLRPRGAMQEVQMSSQPATRNHSDNNIKLLPAASSILTSSVTSLESKQQKLNNSVSPLQQKAKKQRLFDQQQQQQHQHQQQQRNRMGKMQTIQVVAQQDPSDPNNSLQNAQKGIVAHRVRQSLQFQSSLDSYDHERERQLFGKNLLDVQAENRMTTQMIPLKQRTTTTTNSASSHQQQQAAAVQQRPPAKRRLTNVSKLQPQASLLSYQSALGLNNINNNNNNDNRDQSMESLASKSISVQDTSNGAANHFTTLNKKSHAMTRQSSIQKKPVKPQNNFFDKEKVGDDRKRMERMKNVLEIQFEKQNSSLERNLRNQVTQSINKHMKSVQSNKSGLTIAQNANVKDINATAFNQINGHRQGQMLDRFKTIESLADFGSRDGSQSGVKSTKQLQNQPQQQYLPLIQSDLAANQMAVAKQGSMNGKRQLDDEIQKFEKRNKLLSGIMTRAVSHDNVEDKLFLRYEQRIKQQIAQGKDAAAAPLPEVSTSKQFSLSRKPTVVTSSKRLAFNPSGSLEQQSFGSGPVTKSRPQFKSINSSFQI